MTKRVFRWRYPAKETHKNERYSVLERKNLVTVSFAAILLLAIVQLAGAAEYDYSYAEG